MKPLQHLPTNRELRVAFWLLIAFIIGVLCASAQGNMIGVTNRICATWPMPPRVDTDGKVTPIDFYVFWQSDINNFSTAQIFARVDADVCDTNYLSATFIQPWGRTNYFWVTTVAGGYISAPSRDLVCVVTPPQPPLFVVSNLPPTKVWAQRISP